MPKFEEVDGDAVSPSDLTEDDLVAALEEASAEVERIRQVRSEVRELTPKSGLLDALAETDDEFAAAIDAQNAAEHALGRFRGSAEGQHVAVGTADESEGNG